MRLNLVWRSALSVIALAVLLGPATGERADSETTDAPAPSDSEASSERVGVERAFSGESIGKSLNPFVLDTRTINIGPLDAPRNNPVQGTSAQGSPAGNTSREEPDVRVGQIRDASPEPSATSSAESTTQPRTLFSSGRDDRVKSSAATSATPPTSTSVSPVTTPEQVDHSRNVWVPSVPAHQTKPEEDVRNNANKGQATPSGMGSSLLVPPTVNPSKPPPMSSPGVTEDVVSPKAQQHKTSTSTPRVHKKQNNSYRPAGKPEFDIEVHVGVSITLWSWSVQWEPPEESLTEQVTLLLKELPFVSLLFESQEEYEERMRWNAQRAREWDIDQTIRRQSRRIQMNPDRYLSPEQPFKQSWGAGAMQPFSESWLQRHMNLSETFRPLTERYLVPSYPPPSLNPIDHGISTESMTMFSLAALRSTSALAVAWMAVSSEVAADAYQASVYPLDPAVHSILISQVIADAKIDTDQPRLVKVIFLPSGGTGMNAKYMVVPWDVQTSHYAYFILQQGKVLQDLRSEPVLPKELGIALGWAVDKNFPAYLDPAQPQRYHGWIEHEMGRRTIALLKHVTASDGTIDHVKLERDFKYELDNLVWDIRYVRGSVPDHVANVRATLSDWEREWGNKRASQESGASASSSSETASQSDKRLRLRDLPRISIGPEPDLYSEALLSGLPLTQEQDTYLDDLIDQAARLP